MVNLPGVIYSLIWVSTNHGEGQPQKFFLSANQRKRAVDFPPRPAGSTKGLKMALPEAQRPQRIFLPGIKRKIAVDFPAAAGRLREKPEDRSEDVADGRR